MSSGGQTLILLFNTMWGDAPDIEGLDLPDRCELTTDKTRFRNATAVVFHIPSLREPLPPARPPDQVWVAWSMECEVHYPRVRDAQFMRHFDLTMTYHHDADVPVPYYGPDLMPGLKGAPRPKTKDRLAAHFVSSPYDRSGRRKLATELMRYLDVHSYGRDLTNRWLDEDRGRATKLEVIASYKFTLAFENAIAPDYVTEKLYDPLVAGSVPVYLGAPNVDQFAPADHCFVDVTDFAEPRDLADYLLTLNENDAAYEEYFAWKHKPLRSSFIRLLTEQREHAFVRLCRAVRGLTKDGR
jgi:hypothetical protein